MARHSLRTALVRLATDNPQWRSQIVRVLLAGETAQTRMLQNKIKVLNENLQEVAPWYKRRRIKQPAAEAAAAATAQAAQEVLDVLHLEFESADYGKLISKRLIRITNFRKMLALFAAAPSWAKLQPVLEKLDTKSKDAWEKYRDLRDFAVGVLNALDVEVEDVLAVGPWMVRLMTAPRTDWDRAYAERLQQIVQSAVSIIDRGGLGAAIGGRMQAWPTTIVPVSGRGSSGTLASYNPKNDLVRLAVGNEIPKTVENLIHELGHRFYFRALGNRGRHAWDEFFGGEQGVPDLDSTMRAWEAYAAQHKYGAWLGHFHGALKATDPEAAFWLGIAANEAHIDEKFDQLTGKPKGGKKAKPGLQQMKEALPELRVFLHPVTAYSATSAEELFAETFSHILVKGPGRIPPIVRDAFRRAVPQAKVAARTFLR